jgi:hypothetical protein
VKLCAAYVVGERRARMETQGVRELELALEAREEAERRFEAAVGTSTEMGAYMRLRKASRRVSELDRSMREADARVEVQAV